MAKTGDEDIDVKNIIIIELTKRLRQFKIIIISLIILSSMLFVTTAVTMYYLEHASKTINEIIVELEEMNKNRLKDNLKEIETIE